MLRSSFTSLPYAIVLGSKRSLHIWTRDLLSKGADRLAPSGTIELSLPSVTSTTSVGGSIAVASRNHHAIHLFGSDGVFTRTCLAHAGGVSALGPLGEWTFLSGSSDATARIWDVRMDAPAAQLQRHLGSVTMVGSGRFEALQYIWSAGEDHIVKGWDMRSPRPLYEAEVGIGVPIAAGMGSAGQIRVLTKHKDDTCAEGYQPQPADETHLCGACPSLALEFRPPKGFPAF
jgi:WD40 repeat protein